LRHRRGRRWSTGRAAGRSAGRAAGRAAGWSVAAVVAGLVLVMSSALGLVLVGVHGPSSPAAPASSDKPSGPLSGHR
jgi:hypothetical protein